MKRFILPMIIGLIGVCALAVDLNVTPLKPEDGDSANRLLLKQTEALASLAGQSSVAVTLGSLNTTNTSTTTPIVLGTSSAAFSTVTFVGDKQPRIANSGTVWIQVVSTDGTNAIPLPSGGMVTWTAPAGKYATAAQFWIDVEVVNDGVIAIYAK